MICLGRLQIIYLGMICGCSLSHSSICNLWFLISMIDVWQLPIFRGLPILAIYNGSRQRLLWYVTSLSTAPTKHHRQWYLQNIIGAASTKHRRPRFLHDIVGRGSYTALSVTKISSAAASTKHRWRQLLTHTWQLWQMLLFYYCVDHQ